MLLRSALLACCLVATVTSKEISIDARRVAPTYYDDTQDYDYRSRIVPREEFLTSHRIPDSAVRYAKEDVGRDIKFGKAEKKVISHYETDDRRVNEEPRKKSRIELENFSNAGVIQEDGVRKIDLHNSRSDYQSRDSVIPGVYLSNQYQTTMVPILTTPRDTRSSFDFIPVNIIPEDNKGGYRSFSGDLSDVSLVPAGSNSRIQVKKGPNGKDYEYEYVYYYYDEEDEGKASSTTFEGTRTTPAPRRGAPSSNRNKYSAVERPTTSEPVNNEVIPRGHSNRSRQLVDNESVSEERLPTNTRFPPRSRSNYNSGTTEPTRPRGNRPRPNLDLVDSSSFRTYQEGPDFPQSLTKGPEFPQTLPKGPVRFIGVSPNEDTEDRPVRNRGRPHRVQEHNTDDQPEEHLYRRRPSQDESEQPEIELSKGQPTRPYGSDEDEDDSRTRTYDSTTTDSPTTLFPSAMDKVALDLYAFLQQGQSNLVDSSVDSLNSGESSTVSDEESTTSALSTTESDVTEYVTESVTPSTTTTTTTTTPKPTTTTTTTTEAPSTPQVGRGKFRRPGVPGGAAISRNRFKSNTNSSPSTTESPTETSTKTRGRYGSNNNNSSGGYKRSRPSQKSTEESTKETSSGSVTAEKTTSRNRFRGSGYRNSASSTASPVNSSAADSTVGASRPAFNKLNISNRRRGRPTAAPSTTLEDTQEGSETSQTEVHEVSSTTPKTAPGQRIRPAVGGPRPIRPTVNRVNLRSRPGQSTTTTSAPEQPDVTPEEPTGEGTEEESHEAPAESSPKPTTTASPLNKLRNKPRLQVHAKATTRAPITSPRRSPLLPRRKTTEAPTEEPVHENAKEEESTEKVEATEAPVPESSTATTTTKEEPRGLSSLLAPRKRIGGRRPGTLLATREP